MKWYLYITETPKILFQTTFHMKLSSVMTENHFGLEELIKKENLYQELELEFLEKILPQYYSCV